MNDNVLQILRAFDGKLVGSKKMKNHVCQTLFHMPQDIINFVTKNCWFMSSMDDAYAFTFTGNDLRDQHLVFLSDDLFDQDNFQINHTIAHEIGHVILGHRNSTIATQTKAEIRMQEKEADLFAAKYELHITGF
jgi:Zn-dependent peptidase ImmA (M78 family)